VPEGIIFQSQTAYKQLRKMLVENSLVTDGDFPAVKDELANCLPLSFNTSKEQECIEFL
jgi:hypothetical protein